MIETSIPAGQVLPPEWLPAALVGSWNFLATYPVVLALIVMLVGVGLAVLGRSFVLYWGGKLARRAHFDLGPRLLRIAANVAALLLACFATVVAIQILGLPEGIERAVIRILLSLLILRLTVSAMRATHIALETLGRIRDRFHIVEERTIPLFDLAGTLLIVGSAAYALLMVWDIDPTAWLASAGVIGIAVGFAARDTLANLFAGFFIIVTRPTSWAITSCSIRVIAAK